MRTTLSFFAILLFSFSAYSQNADSLKHVVQFTDTSKYIIRFKDGSEVKGIIVEKDPAHFIKVKVKSKVHTYAMDELAGIKKVEDENKLVVRESGRHMVFGFKKRGYLGSAAIGISSLFVPKDQTGPVHSTYLFSFDMVNAYQATPFFAIGVGVGVEVVGKQGAMIPVYEDMRIFFMRSHAAFLELPLGYNAMIALTTQTINGNSTSSYETYHGMMFNPSLGFSVPLTKKNNLGLYLTVGYKLWYQHIIINNIYINYDDFIARHGFTARAGVMF